MPITLQTLGVAIAALVLGGLRGASAVAFTRQTGDALAARGILDRDPQNP